MKVHDFISWYIFHITPNDSLHSYSLKFCILLICNIYFFDSLCRRKSRISYHSFIRFLTNFSLYYSLKGIYLPKVFQWCALCHPSVESFSFILAIKLHSPILCVTLIVFSCSTYFTGILPQNQSFLFLPSNLLLALCL